MLLSIIVEISAIDDDDVPAARSGPPECWTSDSAPGVNEMNQKTMVPANRLPVSIEAVAVSMVIKVLVPGWPYSNREVKRAEMQLPQMPGME